LNSRWRYTLEIATYQKPVLIYNPVAGKLRRNPQRTLQLTTEALERARLAPRLLPTETPGHAGTLARQAIAAGADLILVMGGDGTVNETLNGMVHSSVPLAVIPGGTANVLSMELGLGKRAERAIASIGSLVERRVALGRLCAAGAPPRYFLSMGGAGLDAKIVYDLNPRLKARTGKLAYWAAGFGQFTSRVTTLTACINCGDVYSCGFALASRVRNYGGDLEIASGASLLRDDFEVVLFEGTNPLRYAWYMLGVGIRRVQAMQGVHTFRASRVDFTGEGHVQIDGEYAGLLPATFEIEPAALTLLMPPSYG
jgi:YegS/Rv2252/BmrU family lipid kinase